MARTLFLELFDRTTEDASRLIDALPESVWRVQPEGRFGPGEVLVHLMQSESFALQFLLSEAGIGESFELPPAFRELVTESGSERHRKLSELNLRGARAGLARYETLEELRATWWCRRREAYEALVQVPEGEYVMPVFHPLVELEGTWAFMATTLFVSHTYYHMKQMREAIKATGCDASLPFPFGEIPELPLWDR